MGIEVVIEDEERNKVRSLEDISNVLHRVLPKLDDSAYHYLNRIDWYGDTTFNRYQVHDVDRELERLIDGNHGPEERAFLVKLLALVKESSKSPHLYLKFYGD